MILERKKNGRIYPLQGTAIFKHCSGGSISVTEREYPELEKVILSHRVDFIKVIDEKND